MDAAREHRSRACAQREASERFAGTAHLRRCDRGVVALALTLLAGCGNPTLIPLGGVPSPAPRPDPQAQSLVAGFARVDITPPAGVGLMGYATEGAVAKGHRMRLYARAMVLQDSGGERLAIVVVDLMASSAVIHRRVAEKILPGTGIGPDRLIVAGSHTHSGPTHYFGIPGYDELGASIRGYDPALVDSLVTGIARAVTEAWHAKGPARAAWGRTLVWGRTRVRTSAAVERNSPRFLHPAAPPAGLPADPRYRHIDPQLSMLRVDVRTAGGAYEPAGSFIIFPIHGTVNSGGNELLDGDVHTIVAQQLERRIPQDRPNLPGRPPTIHLFANGAEGDITPDFSSDSRCPAPAPRLAFMPTGPRRPPPMAVMQPVTRPPFPECLTRSREAAWSIGVGIADAAASLFRSLDAAIASPAAGNLRLARAYDVLRHTDDSSSDLCEPGVGSGTLAGVEGGFTRVLNLGIRAIGIDTLPDPPTPLPDVTDCLGAKPDMRLLQRILAGKKPLPTEFQLTVMRIGDVVIGTVPGEPTTNAGARMRRAMAPDSQAGAEQIYPRYLVLGLANGYINYVTTAAEYSAQLYEGASTLYGPYTAEIIAQSLRRLARLLPAQGMPSPPATVPVLNGWHRGEKTIVPRPSAGVPAPPQRKPSACWRGDTLVVRWFDHRPGDVYPSRGPLIQIERRMASGVDIETWDDDPFLEVWHLGRHEGRHHWEARYAPPAWTPPLRRAVLVPRGSVPADSTHWLVRGSPACRSA